MRNAINTGNQLRKALFAATVVASALFSLVGVAQAATPAWKLLAVTGPTNLPPKQSEVQRVTVEAGGGTFALGYGGEEEVTTVEGSGTPVVAEAHLDFTAGSTQATIEDLASTVPIEVGDRVARFEEYEYEHEIFIVSCSPDCETVGSTLELSEAAPATESTALRQIYTNRVEGVTGSFQLGDEIVGKAYEGAFDEYYPRETVVTAVGSGTLTLSKPTSFEYVTFEGELELFTERARIVPAELTEPIAFDASPQEVQAELEALPRFGPGSLKVEGGPGGDVNRRYFVEFDGPPLMETNVEALEAQTTGLIGDAASVHVFTTVPGGPGTGEIVIDPVNIGGAKSQGLATLRIGPLPVGVRSSGPATGSQWKCPGGTHETTIVCTLGVSISATTPVESVRVPLEVESTLGSSLMAPIEMSGGGSRTATYELPIEISRDPAPFATRAFWAGSFDADGNLETQAGAHPFSAGTFFLVNTVRARSGKIVPTGTFENVEVDLPPGFSGDPLVTDRCPQSQVGGEEGFPLCNQEMRVGTFGPITDELSHGAGLFSFGITNDRPPRGYAAEFSSKIVYPIQSLLASVRSDEDFGVRITAPNIPNLYKLYGSYASLDGEPAAAHGKAFLTNPSNCAEEAQSPPVVGLRTKAYEPSLATDYTSVTLPPVTGCNRLKFEPSFDLKPSTTQGSSPAGASAVLHISQNGLTDPKKFASPNLKKAVVTLPRGLAVNPSSANGLQSCRESEMGYEGPGTMPNPTRFNEAPVTCPDGSKLGTVKVKTPLLESELEGTIYLAAQEENPFHSLLALYLVVESERFGITLKLPGEVQPDPTTGQLTAVFDNNPQLPFEDLTLNFRGGGPRSTLATPEVCGHYATTGSLEPWSAPESGPPAQINEAGFTVNTGCSPSAATRPFVPTFEAGSTSTQAGSYTPIVIKINRKDGEQELSSLNFTLPKGLTGKLAGVSYCPEAAIAAARAKTGKAEQAAPSCPAASQIGTVDTAAGVGTEPIHVGGKVYLAGPYEGAPLSSVVITPAVAGPFDLGDVVIRAPLFVDLQTAEITAKSDPIPTILKGIPLKLRSVAINLDRPSFGLNPTSCEVKAITASMGSSDGATAAPNNRFQVGGCNKLKFKPKLKLSLKGAVKRAGHPALKAVVTYPKKGSYSNIARAQVGLPHSEFLDQDNLENVCTQPQLKTQTCPKKSIYGKAKAWTPLLDKPLEGPVYLGVGFGYKLPALVADLNGQIRILLKGKVDTDPQGGIRNTFEAVPDAPVSRFVLEMKGGKKYGLLENSENICKKTQRASVRLNAQNGLVQQLHPLIGNSCKGKKKKHGKGSKGHKKG